MTTPIRPSKFSIDTWSIDVPAVLWKATLEAPRGALSASRAYREASSDDRVDLEVEYSVNDVTTSLVLVEGGVIDYYSLLIAPGEVSGELQGRNQMAKLLDTEYRCVYRNGEPPKVIEGQLTVPEVNGLFSVQMIAAEVCAAAGMNLVWDGPDYLAYSMINAVGRPYDIVRELVRPFNILEGQCPARKVDVFVRGSTLYVRQRERNPVAPALNRFSIEDARLTSLKLRKFRTPFIGTLEIQGRGLTGAGGSSSTVPVLTWAEPDPILYLTPLSDIQLNPQSSVVGSFSFSPESGSILTEGRKTLTAYFTPDDSAYKSGTVKTRITVTKRLVTIEWTTPANIDESTALDETQLNAVAKDALTNDEVEGNYVYSPSSGTLLKAGDHQLSVTFTPTDNGWDKATAVVNIHVTGTPPAVEPVIVWPTPAPIFEGVAIDGTQLNPLAYESEGGPALPGTFTFTPFAGSTFRPGTHTLKTTFTPDDPDAFKEQKAEVTLTVLPITVTWLADTQMFVGDAIGAPQTNAIANTAGTFEYDPPVGTVESEVGTFTLTLTFTPDVVGPAPVILYRTITVKEPGTTTGDGTSTLPPGSTESVSSTYTAGHVTVTVRASYRMPDKLLLQEESIGVNSFRADDPLFGPIRQSSVIFYKFKTLAWEDSTYDAAGNPVNQPSQLSEDEITYQQSPGALCEKKTGYAYDELKLLTQETETTSYATGVITVDSSGKFITSNGQSGSSLFDALSKLPRIPTQITIKRYIDLAPDLYAVSSETYKAIQTLAPNRQPGDFAVITTMELVPESVTETISSGTRPGGIRSGGGSLASLTPASEKLVPTITWPFPESITWPTALSGTQQNATADVDGDFNYSPASGTVLNPGTRTLRAVFTPKDLTKYVSVRQSTSLIVEKADETITWDDPASIAAGTPLSGTQLNAVVVDSITSDPVDGVLAYSPSIGTVLKAGLHTLHVTFTPTAPQRKIETATASLVVTGTNSAVQPTITWPAIADLFEGSPLEETQGGQLNASAADPTTAVPVPGTFVYTPSAGRTLSAGTHTIHVRFTPTDLITYKAVTASNTITITRITITWGKPASVPVGTALTEEQLDATVNVDEELVALEYNPPLGTALTLVGTTTLAVTATPLNSNGDAISKSIEIKVVAADGAAGGITAYESRSAIVSTERDAVTVSMSDSNLSQEVVDLVWDQAAECSGLWQHEATFSGVGIAWLQPGDYIKFLNPKDEKGVVIDLPTFLIQSIKLTYDEGKAVIREAKALAWTTS